MRDLVACELSLLTVTGMLPWTWWSCTMSGMVMLARQEYMPAWEVLTVLIVRVLVREKAVVLLSPLIVKLVCEEMGLSLVSNQMTFS